MELYKKYRPRSLDMVTGQDGAVASIRKLINANKIPHAILLTGPSGCGKTTIARILKNHLRCGDADFVEVNCADLKGVDTIRDIRRHCNLSPMEGPVRIWLIDEAHKLTNDAQNAFLKLLEDTPTHAYFMLATTDPQKLIKTIHTRCSEVKLNSMDAGALERVVKRVVMKEDLLVSQKVVDEIVEASDGSARKALVILEQIALLRGDKEQIESIQSTTINKDLGFALAKLLVFSGDKANWSEVAGILKELKDGDAEGVRYIVLGFARAILLGGGRLAPHAFKVIEIFARNFYDSKHAGLAAACWEVVKVR